MAENSIILAAAIAAHEANRAWCIAHNDASQLHWEDAPPWQKESAINGVMGVIAGNGPAESHASWLAEKKATGWKYGPVKDPEKREHPCFVPYEELPPEQKAKDGIFVSTVSSVLAAGGIDLQAARSITFREELARTINRYSKENDSNTPDFILSQFLLGCLGSFSEAMEHRETWWGRGNSFPKHSVPTRATASISDGATPEDFCVTAKSALDSLLGSVRVQDGVSQDDVRLSVTRDMDKTPVSIGGDRERFSERSSTFMLTVVRNPPIDL